MLKLELSTRIKAVARDSCCYVCVKMSGCSFFTYYKLTFTWKIVMFMENLRKYTYITFIIQRGEYTLKLPFSK